MLNPPTITSDKITILQNPKLEEMEKVAQDQQGVLHRKILYNKYDKPNGINVKKMPIDFDNAVREVNSLSITNDFDAFITFRNESTNETYQLVKIEDNLWYADAPIKDGSDWEGYYWGCRADTKSILNTLERFFEEGGNWFHTLPFTMRRYKK